MTRRFIAILFALVGCYWCYQSGAIRLTSLIGRSTTKPNSSRDLRGARFGFFGENGRVVVGPMFLKADAFSEGLAAVRTKSSWGYIDPTGQFAIRPAYRSAAHFSHGLARVRVGGQPEKLEGQKKGWMLGGKFGFIDKRGSMVIPARLDWSNSFSEGIAVCGQGTNKWLLATDGARTALPKETVVCGNYKCGLARICIGTPRMLWGYIDKRGGYAIPPSFDVASDFSGDLACVKQGAKWMYITRTGEIAIEPPCNEAKAFSEGLASIRIGDKWGVIGEDGLMRIGPLFDETGSFSSGLCSVRIKDKWGYIDSDGNTILRPKYLRARPFSAAGRAAALTGIGWGVIDRAGRWIVRPKYSFIGDYAEGAVVFGSKVSGAQPLHSGVAPNGVKDRGQE